MTTTEPQPGRTVAEVVTDTVAALEGQRGALLPILHAIQETLGCVPREAVPVLAERLNLSRADVHGVVSFYHDFRSEPAGLTSVKVCRAEACQSVENSELAFPKSFVLNDLDVLKLGIFGDQTRRFKSSAIRRSKNHGRFNGLKFKPATDGNRLTDTDFR